MKFRTKFLCRPNFTEQVFPASVLEHFTPHIEGSVEFVDPVNEELRKAALVTTEVIVGTWGMPKLDRSFLEAAPALRTVLYAAGSVKSFVTEEFWERGIKLSSAWAANGIPVSEYVTGAILLSLKRFWHFSRHMREEHQTPQSIVVPGAFRSKVGLISMGAVGRLTTRLLRNFDLDVMVFDPFLSLTQASELGVRLVGLDELFRECDVVSIHAPAIPATERMITGAHVASMKEGATLINTSRGIVISEDEVIKVLTSRRDLTAILDVTHPEPPVLDSPLRRLPNIILTPHIAGSMNAECARMGFWMAEELARLAKGEALHYEVTRAMLATMA